MFLSLINSFLFIGEWLQYCDGLCHMSIWVSHRYTWVSLYSEPPSLLPPHPDPLGCPWAPGLGVLLHASNLCWSTILHMAMYPFQSYSSSQCFKVSVTIFFPPETHESSSGKTFSTDILATMVVSCSDSSYTCSRLFYYLPVVNRFLDGPVISTSFYPQLCVIPSPWMEVEIDFLLANRIWHIWGNSHSHYDVLSPNTLPLGD